MDARGIVSFLQLP
jgi:hypothetical protein